MKTNGEEWKKWTNIYYTKKLQHHDHSQWDSLECQMKKNQEDQILRKMKYKERDNEQYKLVQLALVFLWRVLKIEMREGNEMNQQTIYEHPESKESWENERRISQTVFKTGPNVSVFHPLLHVIELPLIVNADWLLYFSDTDDKSLIISWWGGWYFCCLYFSCSALASASSFSNLLFSFSHLCCSSLNRLLASSSIILS